VSRSLCEPTVPKGPSNLFDKFNAYFPIHFILVQIKVQTIAIFLLNRRINESGEIT
jgi:hypothetical protein